MRNSITCAAAAFTLVMAAALWFAGCGGSSDEKPSGETPSSESGMNNGSSGGSLTTSNTVTEFYPPGGPVEVAEEDLVGDFSTTDINGKPIRLSDYKGKVVLLDFWASWCPPCEREVPNMKKVYKKYRDKGFEIIGVSLDNDSDDLREFIKETGIDWPQIFTGHGWETPIVIHYSVNEIPEPWLIGKDGRLITKEARGEYLEPLVKKALKEEVEEEE